MFVMITQEWYDKKDEIVNVQFDSRVFNLPESEIVNYFIWRQLDWTRNSINMLGFSKFSTKEMQGKNTNQVQEMLFQEHDINWDKYDTYIKRGTGIRKQGIRWVFDINIPIFTKDRDYITNMYKTEDD